MAGRRTGSRGRNATASASRDTLESRPQQIENTRGSNATIFIPIGARGAPIPTDGALPP